MTLTERLSEYVRACFTGLWIESHEHQDALVEIAQLCRDEDWRLAVWDIDRGLQINGQNDAVELVAPLNQQFSAETGRQLAPFGSFSIEDVDRGDTLRVTVTASASSGATGILTNNTNASSTTNDNTAAITFEGSRADVETDLRNLIYTAPNENLGDAVREVTLTLEVTDAIGLRIPAPGRQTAEETARATGDGAGGSALGRGAEAQASVGGELEEGG